MVRPHLSDGQVTPSNSIRQQDFSNANVPISRETWAPRSPPSRGGDERGPPPPSSGYSRPPTDPYAERAPPQGPRDMPADGGYDNGRGGGERDDRREIKADPRVLRGRLLLELEMGERICKIASFVDLGILCDARMKRATG